MQDLLALTNDLPEVVLAPDEVLLEQGSMPGKLWVLADGVLEISRDGLPFATVDTPGAVIGEMSAVLDSPATATVRALTACRLHVTDDPIGLLTDRPGVAVAALHTAASRLDSLTRYLTDVKRQYAELTGHLGMVDDVLNVLIHHQPAPVRPGSAREPDPEY